MSFKDDEKTFVTTKKKQKKCVDIRFFLNYVKKKQIFTEPKYDTFNVFEKSKYFIENLF